MDWLECTRYLRKVNKMDDKKLNIIVEGLYPLVKENSDWITTDRLKDLKHLLVHHDYYECSTEELGSALAYTYLDICDFSGKYSTVNIKKDVLKRFTELFTIYKWLRHTSSYKLSFIIPLSEVDKVISKLLDKILKTNKAYLIKNVNGEYSSICYNKITGEVKGSKYRLGYNLEEIKRLLNNDPLTNNYRYATKEEVDNLLMNFYGLNPENLPDGVVVEITLGGE